MSHTILWFAALAAQAFPLPAHAEIAFQIAGVDSANPGQIVMVTQLSTAPAPAFAATIDQAGSRLPVFAAVNAVTQALADAAFVEQAAGIAGLAKVPDDPSGNISMIEQSGLANTATVEQTGLLNASLITQSGAGNDCTVIQSSNGNASVVNQTGTNGFVSVRQG